MDILKRQFGQRDTGFAAYDAGHVKRYQTLAFGIIGELPQCEARDFSPDSLIQLSPSAPSFILNPHLQGVVVGNGFHKGGLA